MTEHYPAGGIEHYDRQGQRIDLWTWCKLTEQPDYKRVAQDQVGDTVISTNWIGFDLGLSYMMPHLPMLLFETMVFGGPFDMEQRRWATEVQALAGHDQIVTMLREGNHALNQAAQAVDNPIPPHA